MKKIDEENKIIIKNLICFFFSFFHIFSTIFFETELSDALVNYLGIFYSLFFIALVYVISAALSLFFLGMTVKYMIEMIRNKRKIIPMIEITIYILIIINDFIN